jgi:acyl carrier protein
LARHAGDGGKDESNTDDIQYLLEELSDAQLLSTIIDMLKSEVGEILQVSPDKIDPARSMYDMGLDSLMGVELVVVLEARFGARLPVMALSQNPTIAKLAERIIQQLKGTEETDAASDENELLAQAKLLASQHGAEVSAGSIADLAEDLQSRETGSNDKIIH